MGGCRLGFWKGGRGLGSQMSLLIFTFFLGEKGRGVRLDPRLDTEVTHTVKGHGLWVVGRKCKLVGNEVSIPWNSATTEIERAQYFSGGGG